MNYQEILDFWFDPKNQSWWFSQNDAFDKLIEEKFKTIHQQAAHAELWSWRSSAEGRLAEIIVLDQLSRNLYRHPYNAVFYICPLCIVNRNLFINML